MRRGVDHKKAWEELKEWVRTKSKRKPYYPLSPYEIMAKMDLLEDITEILNQSKKPQKKKQEEK